LNFLCVLCGEDPKKFRGGLKAAPA
jgi:hypothetical protein